MVTILSKDSVRLFLEDYIFSSLGEDATNQMLSEANRVFFSPAVLTIPMMIAYALTMMYLSGIFFPYGMAFAQGNFTGGFFGGILYRKYLGLLSNNTPLIFNCMNFENNIYFLNHF